MLGVYIGVPLFRETTYHGPLVASLSEACRSQARLQVQTNVKTKLQTVEARVLSCLQGSFSGLAQCQKALT